MLNTFLKSLTLVFITCISVFAQQVRRPNIVLIITDDQGYGDFGFTGNPHVRTPHVDQLAARSVRLMNFHVSPVCAPTRASLLTGRYHQRTGVHDTYNGGAVMATEEETLAEILQKSGYATGIVGKWHLGDNYPFRPSDQGFEYSLVHGGGGVGQPGDFYGNFIRTDSSYFDPTLSENNKKVTRKGYCSDVFTDQALAYLKQHKADPFFLYVSYNAPHTPLQLPEKYENMYRDLKFDSETDKKQGSPWAAMTEKDQADARKVYGMATNIDDNVGRILNELKTQHLDENTIVIFMTDNGNQQLRFNTGFRGLKGTVYEGGTRVPLLISGAGLFPENRKAGGLIAHIDLLPTLLEAAKIPLPKSLKVDGKSALGQIQGKAPAVSRLFYNSWNRGWPEPYRNAAFYKGNYKMTAVSADERVPESFGLFDLEKDPYERHNLISKEPALAKAMRLGLDSVFADISASPHLSSRRIIIDPSHEPISVLTKQDLMGTGVSNWLSEKALGYWLVTVATDGFYDFKTLHDKPVPKGTRSLLRIGAIQRSYVLKEDAARGRFPKLFLKKGDHQIESWFEGKDGVTSPFYLEVSLAK